MSEWKKVKIGEIFKIEKGSLQSSKCIPGKYDFITAASEWKTHESYSHECEAIVYAVAASGSLGRAHYVNGKFIASDLCFILTEKDKEKYPINFQFYQLIFELIREEIVSKTKTGTSKESINQKNFSNYEIPYFSFDYQMANYEKLVNTKQKISELLEESEKQKSYAKQLRQNILQEAIEGKLTEEWRKENPVVKGNPDFDAEALFEKIQEEKCHTDSELPLGTSLRIRNSKKKVFEPIAENEQPFEMPEGWKWVRLGEIVENITSGSREWARYYSDTGAIFLRMGNLSRESYVLRLDNIQHVRVPESSEGKRTRLLPFDLLFSITAEIGNLGLIPKDFPEAYINQHTARIRFAQLVKQSLYFANALLAPGIRNLYLPNAHGIKNSFRLDTLSFIPIPLPPLAEQKEIVSRVEKLLENVVELEKQITEREEMTKQLMQSIMKDAFREG